MTVIVFLHSKMRTNSLLCLTFIVLLTVFLWHHFSTCPCLTFVFISKSQQQAFKRTDFSVQKEEKKQQLALLAKLVSEGNRSSLFQKASRFFTISTMDFSFPCSWRLSVFKWGKKKKKKKVKNAMLHMYSLSCMMRRWSAAAFDLPCFKKSTTWTLSSTKLSSALPLLS